MTQPQLLATVIEQIEKGPRAKIDKAKTKKDAQLPKSPTLYMYSNSERNKVHQQRMADAAYLAKESAYTVVFFGMLLKMATWLKPKKRRVVL